MSSDAGQSQTTAIIIGIFIGVIVTMFGVLLQYKLTEQRDKRKRRTIAYAHLNEIVARIEAKFQAKQARLTEEEYDKLQEIVANNYDALKNSTIVAWNTKKRIRLVYGEGSGPYEIDLEQFCQDVKQQYEKLQVTG